MPAFFLCANLRTCLLFSSELTLATFPSHAKVEVWDVVPAIAKRPLCPDGGANRLLRNDGPRRAQKIATHKNARSTLSKHSKAGAVLSFDIHSYASSAGDRQRSADRLVHFPTHKSKKGDLRGRWSNFVRRKKQGASPPRVTSNRKTPGPRLKSTCALKPTTAPG